MNSFGAYAELTVSSLAMAMTTTSTHRTYPRKNGRAELARVAGGTPRWYMCKVTHLSINRAQRRVTSVRSKQISLTD